MADDERTTCINIRSAVRGAIPGEMVSKVIVIAESFDGDGRRCFWATADPDMTPWDFRGLMEYALECGVGDADDDD